MAYAQKIVMTKSGSNWNSGDEALQEIQSDMNDADYVTYLEDNTQFHEIVHYFSSTSNSLCY